MRLSPEDATGPTGRMASGGFSDNVITITMATASSIIIVFVFLR